MPQVHEIRLLVMNCILLIDLIVVRSKATIKYDEKNHLSLKIDMTVNKKLINDVGKV